MSSITQTSLLVVFASGIVLAGSLPVGQRPYGRMGPRYYDTRAEVILRGEVQEVLSARTGMQGLQLRIRTRGNRDDTITVALAPEQYLSRNNIAFAKGDRVEVTGVAVRRGRVGFVARTVRKGDRELQLRDSLGRPLWRRAYRAAEPPED